MTTEKSLRRDKYQVWVSDENITYIKKVLTDRKNPNGHKLAAPKVKTKLLRDFIDEYRALEAKYRKLEREAKEQIKQIDELSAQIGGDANGSFIVLQASDLERNSKG